MKVIKKSGKKFKSGKLMNTVKGVIPHPDIPGEEAYIFEEDSSYVHTKICKEIEEYVPVIGMIVPGYLYIEGKPKEEYWIDSQSLEYFLFTEKKRFGYSKETNLCSGKNWWILSPNFPKGVKLKKSNQSLIVWAVDWSSIEEDEDKIWNFEEHKPESNKLKIYYGE